MALYAELDIERQVLSQTPMIFDFSDCALPFSILQFVNCGEVRFSWAKKSLLLQLCFRSSDGLELDGVAVGVNDEYFLFR